MEEWAVPGWGSGHQAFPAVYAEFEVPIRQPQPACMLSHFGGISL